MPTLCSAAPARRRLRSPAALPPRHASSPSIWFERRTEEETNGSMRAMLCLRRREGSHFYLASLLEATEEGRSGWSADPSRRQVLPAGMNARGLSKQNFSARQEMSTTKDALFSSSALLGRSSGSFRHPAISNSRELKNSEAETSRSRTPDPSSGAFHRNAPPHRTSQMVDYSDLRHSSSGRHMPNTKNYESTVRGIQGLNFDANDRIHY